MCTIQHTEYGVQHTKPAELRSRMTWAERRESGTGARSESMEKSHITCQCDQNIPNNAMCSFFFFFLEKIIVIIIVRELIVRKSMLYSL